MNLTNQELTLVELIGLVLSAIGVLFAFLSITFVYIIFIRTQKNYYKDFLNFLKKKKKSFLRMTKRYKINEDLIVTYLIEDLRFFTEDFLINFSADGTLKYPQYELLRTMYKHIKKRFLITRKVTKKAINKGYKNIDIRVQLFGKYNTLNEKYFDHKLKNAKYKKENINVYASRIFNYNHQTKSFDLKPRKKPILYEMGSDSAFKKNIYYIFSSANEIEQALEGTDLEKRYFFIACSYTDKAEKHNKKDDDKLLEKREKIQEKHK